MGGGCFCDRDFTVSEVEKIVKELRDSEKYVKKRYGYGLFQGKSCKIPTEDKSYKRFTEELNKAMRKYNINTCTRKSHFMAQIYWEGARFKTTLEYASGSGYNPGNHSAAKKHDHTKLGDGPRYKGRGLMQLTWRDTQMEYFEMILKESPALLGNKSIDILFDRGKLYKENYIYYSKSKKKRMTVIYDVDSASLIASNLYFSVDSAGWFWDKYKKYKGHNLNYYADFGGKYVNWISTLVNGGGNGKSNRKVYFEKLEKDVFKVKEECVNYDKIKK